jgi:hypothetical protein
MQTPSMNAPLPHEARRYRLIQYIELAFEFYAMRGQFSQAFDLLVAMNEIEVGKCFLAEMQTLLIDFDGADEEFTEWAFGDEGGGN